LAKTGGVPYGCRRGTGNHYIEAAAPSVDESIRLQSGQKEASGSGRAGGLC